MTLYLDLAEDGHPLDPSIDDTIVTEHSLTGRKTVLQRWQPGFANAQEIFVCTYIEGIYIAEGDLTDARHGQSWQKEAHAFRWSGWSMFHQSGRRCV